MSVCSSISLCLLQETGVNRDRDRESFFFLREIRPTKIKKDAIFKLRMSGKLKKLRVQKAY
jgi:hypothetical protein